MNSYLAVPPVLQDTWGESPCSECPETPCCRRAPLVSVSVSTRTGMEALSVLTQRSNLEVGLKDNGRWSVYYRAACRFLNTADGKCRIFGMPDQSIVCKTYNAHRCGYKPAFAGTANSRMIRYNSRRFSDLIQILTFRPDGEIDSVPDWTELAANAARIPYPLNPLSVSALPLPRISNLCTINDLGYLPFPPYEKPATLSQCDLLRFRLGFSGAYLALTDSSWFTLIPAPHITKNSMGERDHEFGGNPIKQPTDVLPSIFEDVLMISYEDFPRLLGKLETDDQGKIIGIPPIKDLAASWDDDNPRTPLKSA